MPIPLPPASRPRLLGMLTTPWSHDAWVSPAVREWRDKHGYITPHFTWASYACQDGTPVPPNLRSNAVKLHWHLELLRHEIGDLAMTVDGPYRTVERNREVGGAADIRHLHADAADFFVRQVDRWIQQNPKISTHDQILQIADRVFANGGLGNENSGTLHVDARGTKARFVTWTPAK